MTGSTNSLKIAMVSPYDFSHPGGVNSHISQLSKELTKAGHLVNIVAPCSYPENIPTDIEFSSMGHCIPIKYQGSIARLSLSVSQKKRVKQLLDKHSYDIVHLHEPLAPLIPLWFLEYSKSTNIGTFHANIGQSVLYSMTKPLVQRWHKRIHGRIAVSQTAKHCIANHFPGNYHIIPNGIDTNHFADSADPLPEFSDGKINLLFVGRLEKKKGLKYLLIAFKHVSRIYPNIRLIIVGPGKLDSECSKILKSIDSEDVIIIGEVSYHQLPRYYVSAHVFCCPSTGPESFGIVLLEAMASGIPVIASDISGYNEIIRSRYEGLLVNTYELRDMEQAILYLVKNPQLRLHMGSIAKISAQRYSWGSIAHTIEEFYYEQLDNSASRTALNA